MWNSFLEIWIPTLILSHSTIIKTRRVTITSRTHGTTHSFKSKKKNWLSYSPRNYSGKIVIKDKRSVQRIGEICCLLLWSIGLINLNHGPSITFLKTTWKKGFLIWKWSLSWKRICVLKNVFISERDLYFGK